MKKLFSILVALRILILFSGIARAQSVPSIVIEPPDWYAIGDTFVSLDAEVHTAGLDSLFVGGYVMHLCDQSQTDTLIEYQVYDPEFQDQGFGWFVHPLDPDMKYCWIGYVRRGNQYVWSEYAYWGMEPTNISSEPSIETVFTYSNGLCFANRNIEVVVTTCTGQQLEVFCLRAGQTRFLPCSNAPILLVVFDPENHSLLGKKIILGN